jgi:UDP-glucose 4-epimerase
MSVLVTGGAGYVGSHTVLDLLEAGEPVVVLDDLSTGHAWAVPKGSWFVQGDIGHQPLVGKLLADHGVNAIMHFAASAVVPDSVADPLAYYLNNTVKSHALIEAALKAGVRHFIFSSTAAVYGMPGGEPVEESAPLAPLSPYGASKLMTELMLADVARAHDFSYVVLRYFNVAGADAKGRVGQSSRRSTHLIKAACETALGKRHCIEVFGSDYPTPDGTCVRDYIHVTDLSRAHLAALRHLRQDGGSDVFNCGYSRGFSVLEVIEAVKRVSGRAFEVRRAPPRMGDPAMVVAASHKIKQRLRWTPEHDNLETIVRHAMAWEERLSCCAYP